MEHNHTQQNSIEEKVLEKIQSGEVKMHSRTFFVLKVTVLVLVAILVLVTSAVLVSFMLFSLRVSGRLFLLGFGDRGILAFLITFPWFILLADILFIVLFERLLNHFKFGYRTPLLYTLGASAVLIIVAGVALDRLSIHDTLFQEAVEHHLGPIGDIYTDVRLPPRQEGVFRGIVTGVNAVSSSNPFISAFDMRRDDEDTDTDDATGTATIWHVILPPGVSIAGFLQPGDVVLVAGDVLSASGTVNITTGTSTGTIRAYGIKKIEAGDEQ